MSSEVDAEGGESANASGRSDASSFVRFWKGIAYLGVLVSALGGMIVLFGAICELDEQGVPLNLSAQPSGCVAWALPALIVLSLVALVAIACMDKCLPKSARRVAAGASFLALVVAALALAALNFRDAVGSPIQTAVYLFLLAVASSAIARVAELRRLGPAVGVADARQCALDIMAIDSFMLIIWTLLEILGR